MAERIMFMMASRGTVPFGGRCCCLCCCCAIIWPPTMCGGKLDAILTSLVLCSRDDVRWDNGTGSTTRPFPSDPLNHHPNRACSQRCNGLVKLCRSSLRRGRSDLWSETRRTRPQMSVCYCRCPHLHMSLEILRTAGD